MGISFRGIVRLVRVTAMFSWEAFLYAVWGGGREETTMFRSVGKWITLVLIGRSYHAGKRLRRDFERLGPTYVKFGQILSTRWDWLPKEATHELEQLQVNVSPFSLSTARRTLEQAFKKPLREIFSEFDEVPVASASLGQVYKARLPSGQSVAVKIQRPQVRGMIRRDVIALMLAVRIAVRIFPRLRPYNLEEVVKEFERWTMNELDYTREAANADLFGEHFKDDPHVASPKVYWDYVTKEVLTLEYIEAESLSTLLKEAGRERYKRTIVRNGMRSFIRQYFEYGFFHADPHPNNIFVSKDGTLYFLDFGMVGRLDPRLTELIAGAFLGLLQRDAEKIAQLMSMIHAEYAEEISEMPQAQYNQLRKQLGEVVDQWMGVRDRQHNFTRIFYELVQTTVRNGFFVPVDVVMMAKSIVTLDVVVRELDPDFNFTDYETELVQRILAKKLQPKEITGQVRDMVLALERIIKSFPEYSEGALSMLKRGQRGTEMNRTQLEQYESRRDQRESRRNFALLVAALFVSAALIAQREPAPRLFGAPLALIGLIGGVLLLLKVVFINNSKERR